MDNSLIPEIPASPVNKDLSFSEAEDIPCGQPSPAKKRPNRIYLEEPTYQKVRSHAETLKELQANVIALTKTITQVDDTSSQVNQLKVRRDPPRLPGDLNHSEEFTESWDSILQRAGRNLCRVWRDELSRQAKRQRVRFLEKESRANADLESTVDSTEAKRLLNTILKSAATRQEARRPRRPKAPRGKAPKRKEARKHPYKR